MLDELIDGLTRMPSVRAGELFHALLADAEDRRYVLIRHAMTSWTTGDPALARRLLEAAR